MSSEEEKSFAQMYSTEFEEMILEIVNDTLKKNYKIVYSKSTSEKSDGGYDGYCIFQTSNDNEITTLLEAKLRTCCKDLPLSDFSKSVIIAINLDAACIVIGTNIYFTSGSVKQLEEFIYNTGLEIRTVDYKDILNWMDRNPDECKKYDQRFIKELKKYAKKNYETASRSLSLLENTGFTYSQETDMVIYGNDRRVIRRNIVCEIRKAPRSFVITGEKGIGKKSLIHSILYRLMYNIDAEKKEIFSIKRIDLSQIRSNNDFIYNIISALWGCNYSDTVDFMNHLADKEYKEQLKKLIPSKIFNTLLSLADSKNNSIDLNVFYSYVSCLYNQKTSNKRVLRVFYFYNAEYTNNEILKNVITFIRKMSRSVSIILCMQKEQPDNSSIDWWNDFYCSVCECEGIIQYNLTEWKSFDSTNFVKSYSTDKDVSRSSTEIINYFGKNPACIVAGIEMILMDKYILTLIKKENFGLNKAYNFQKLKSAFLYVNKLMNKIQLKMYFLLLLINEKLEFGFLKEVLELDEDRLDNEAYSMPFIKYEDGFLYWKYRLYGDLFAEDTSRFLNLLEEKDLLNKVVLNINSLSLSIYKNNYVLLKTYLKLRKYSEAEDLSLKFIKDLKSKEQYTDLYYVTSMMIDNGLFKNDTHRDIILRIEYLKSALKIGMNGDDTDFESRIKELADIIENAFLESGNNDENTNLLIGEFYHIYSLYHLIHSSYKDMNEDCMVGLKFLSNIKTQVALELKGKLCANCVISIKHLFSIEECVRYLESNEAVELEPAIKETAEYQISYHTHHASLFTGNAPKKALYEFMNIDKICKEYSRETYLHNLHNIASMQFSLKQYDDALNNAQIVYKQSYEYNISVEFGRCQNILGCLMWKKQKCEEAKQYFKCSFQHFKNHLHNTHIWAPLVNLATLCTEENDKQAYFYAEEGFNFLIQHHMDQIMNAKVNGDSIPKVIVAILMLIRNIAILCNEANEVGRYIKKIPTADIQKLFDKYIKEKNMDQLFEGTAYNCDGIVMLKV